jgi:hypothetical protein
MKKSDPSLEQAIQKSLDILKDMPERNSVSAARGRAGFLAQAKTFRASISGPVPGQGRFQLFRTGGRSLRAVNWVTAVVLALVLFFASSAATVYASQESLPGDGLYPLKLLSEDGLLLLTISPSARLNLTLNLTDRRMAEIAGLQSAGRPIPAQVIDRFNSEIYESLQLAAKMPDAGMRQSLAAVSAHAENQLKTMDHLLEGKNAPAALLNTQARLQDQLEDANNGQNNPQEFRQEVEKNSSGKNDQPAGKPNDDPTLTATPTTIPAIAPTATPTITPTPTIHQHKPTHTPKTSKPDPKGNPGSPHKPTPNH